MRGRAPDPDTLADQMRLFGAPAALVAEAEAAKDDGELGVHPDAWPAVELFCLGSTQWRMGPRGPVGLDYAAIEAGCRLRGHQVTPDAMRGLMIIELEALRAMAEQRARA